MKYLTDTVRIIDRPVRIEGGTYTPGVSRDVHVKLECDDEGILRQLAAKAVKSKRGIATALGGLIKVRYVRTIW